MAQPPEREWYQKHVKHYRLKLAYYRVEGFIRWCLSGFPRVRD